MEVSLETRYRVGTAMMIVGLLSTLIVVGMAWGVPLLMWGWDIRRRTSRSMAARDGTTES